MSDRIKLTGALLPVLAGIGGFYYFADQSLLLRVLGLLVMVAIAAAIAYQAEAGRNVVTFFQAAITEARKVVWPTGKETVQTTLVVLVVVILVSIFLWLLDMLLSWAVRVFTG